MPLSFAARAQTSPLLSREMPRPAMAKVVLTEREKRAVYGRILRRASQIAGLTRKETAAALHVDEAQLGRWWSGDENPQAWRYHHHPTLRAAVRLADAEDDASVTVRQVIESVRPALPPLPFSGEQA